MIGVKKKKFRKKKIVYLEFRKKLSNIKVYFQKIQKGNFEFKYAKFINKFKSKSKYILLIGDDDRIDIKNFIKILKYLKKNFSGITTSFQNFKNFSKNKKKDCSAITKINTFNIFNDLSKIGFVSCQIIKTDLIKKIFKYEKKDLITTQFPQNFIILRIIKEFSNWKVTNLKCIYRNITLYNSFLKPEYLLTRLKSEYTGYLMPLKKNYSHFSYEKLAKIYKKVFFENIMSWFFLSIKYCGKKRTFEKMVKPRKVIKEPFLIKIILFFFYLFPIQLLNLCRILKKIFHKIFSKF